jgi:hypothetical protein
MVSRHLGIYTLIETRVEEALINKARLYQNIRKITENRTSRFMQMVSISTRILFTCLYVLVMSSCKIATKDPESTGTSQAISTTQLVPTLELTYTPAPLVTLIASQGPTSFPPRGRIVFEVDVGEAGIYAMDADGRNLEQLVEHVGEDETARPTWSPEGKPSHFSRIEIIKNAKFLVCGLWIRMEIVRSA